MADQNANSALDPYQLWMIRTNLQYAHSEGVEIVVARLRKHGYDAVADAVERLFPEVPVEPVPTEAFEEWNRLGRMGAQMQDAQDNLRHRDEHGTARQPRGREVSQNTEHALVWTDGVRGHREVGGRTSTDRRRNMTDQIYAPKAVADIRPRDVCQLDEDDVAEIETITRRDDGTFIAWCKGDKLPIYFEADESVPTQSDKRIDCELHSTIPNFDHDHGGGMGLYSHLVNDHKRMPALLKFARESERSAEHREMHAQKGRSENKK